MNAKQNTIYKSLLKRLADGIYPYGVQIPFERELAVEFHTNKMNAKRAVERLAVHGLVIRKRRKGTFAAEKLDRKLIRELMESDENAVVVLHSAQPSNIHWHSGTFRALEEAVRPARCRLLYQTIPVNEAPAVFAGMMHSLARLQPRALCVFFDNFELNFLYENSELFQCFKCPVIFLNRTGEPLRFENIVTVDIDHFSDGVRLGKLLAEKQCRHTLFFYPDVLKNCIWLKQRRDGITRELKKNGLPEPGTETEYPRRFIRKHMPDAVIIAINNEIAAGLMDALAKEGIRAGREYRLVTFDDSLPYRSYRMTSLFVPGEEIGSLIGEIICDSRLPRKYLPGLSLRVHSGLAVRETFSLQDQYCSR